MDVIKLLPGQTILDTEGNEITTEDWDSLVCFYDEEKEEQLDLLYEQYGEEYINSQIEKGMQVETEHSDDREMQYCIARDHILEFVDYYERLEGMESEAENEEEVDKEDLTPDVSESNLLESRKKMKESKGKTKPEMRDHNRLWNKINEMNPIMNPDDIKEASTLLWDLMELYPAGYLSSSRDGRIISHFWKEFRI